MLCSVKYLQLPSFVFCVGHKVTYKLLEGWVSNCIIYIYLCALIVIHVTIIK